MGGHKSKQKQETKTTTTTTTTIRDIGLTGAHATDLAAILEQGSVEREQIVADTLETLIQGAGSAYQQLIGGASDLVQTSREVSEAQQQTGLKAIEAGTMAAHPELLTEFNLNKALPYIAVGIALYGALKK